ncbi:hypothetical protein AG1IA_10203 [Rhizoctonia solani AG-1 IA]|uniref:Uncharacterized protein n=1 Tax=Thanatephorus cucumeris (strain AG1-IA) TaxID=983506 RepID=L8WGD9_THACA|nr:hypothetical protein AG1IA_10203 [Rhizoctonia solani AG-1 IA]
MRSPSDHVNLTRFFDVLVSPVSVLVPRLSNPRLGEIIRLLNSHAPFRLNRRSTSYIFLPNPSSRTTFYHKQTANVISHQATAFFLFLSLAWRYLALALSWS